MAREFVLRAYFSIKNTINTHEWFALHIAIDAFGLPDAFL